MSRKSSSRTPATPSSTSTFPALTRKSLPGRLTTHLSKRYFGQGGMSTSRMPRTTSATSGGTPPGITRPPVPLEILYTKIRRKLCILLTTLAVCAPLPPLSAGHKLTPRTFNAIGFASTPAFVTGMTVVYNPFVLPILCETPQDIIAFTLSDLMMCYPQPSRGYHKAASLSPASAEPYSSGGIFPTSKSFSKLTTP